MSERSVSVRLRAEIGQYVSDMNKAGEATAGVGKSGERAADVLSKAQRRQVDSALSVRIAEERVNETRAQGNASASQVLSSEQGLARAKEASAEASNVVAAAQAAQTLEADRSSTAAGRLAQSARQNSEAWSQAAGPLLAVGGSITALGAAALVTGVQYNTLQQTTRAALTTLTGSTEAANAQMDKLDEFARNSPFAKQTFIQAQQQMLGFGVATDKVLPALDAVQNTVAAFGGSNDQIAAIADIMSRIQSEGRLSGDALQRLGYYGVDAAELIGSQMGMTAAEIRDMASKPGGIPVEQIWDPLVKGMDEKFGGAADNVKNTFAGSIDRVKAAWRDLSSELASPFVGPEGGGIFTGLLNESADLMRGFQDLPGPVKGAAGALTGLVGVGSLAAGSFLLLAPRIVETKTALDTLGISGSRGASALGKVGKAAGVLAIAFAALQIADEFLPEATIASTDKFAAAILNAGNNAGGARESIDAIFNKKGGNVLGLQTEIQGLGDALETVSRGGFAKSLESIQSFGVLDTKTGLATDSIKRYDEALTKLYQSGAVDDAAGGAKIFGEEAKRAGLSSKQAAALLPSYQDALQATNNEQKTAGDSAAALAASTEDAAKRMGMSAEELKKLQEGATATATSFIGLGASLNESKVSLGDWLAELEKQNTALTQFTDNALTAANKGLDEGLIASLQAAGPEGALRLAELADASEKEIGRANEAFGNGEAATDRYVDSVTNIPHEAITEFKTPGAKGAAQTAVDVATKYNLTPDQVETVMKALDYASEDIKDVLARLGVVNGKTVTARVKADISQAQSAVRSIQRSLSGLPLFRQITINTKRTTSGDDAGNAARAPKRGYTGMRVPAGFVGGGKVPGTPPADPTVDNVWGYGAKSGEPIRVRSGEWIVNGPQSKKNDKWLAAINAGLNIDDLMKETAASFISGAKGYAGGGQIDAVSNLDLLRMKIRIRDLKRSLSERERYGKGKNKRTRPVLRGYDRTEAIYELREANAEYSAQRRVQAGVPRGTSVDSYNKGRDTSASFAGNADIESFSSPQSVERALARSISDMATFTSLLIDLKRKGAAPWLLQQLQKAGPTKGAIRLARKYSTDATALRSVNTQAAQLDAVSNIYGSVTADPKWEASKAWSGGTSAAQQSTLTKSVQVSVQAIDATAVARAVSMHLTHDLQAMATGAGV